MIAFPDAPVRSRERVRVSNPNRREPDRADPGRLRERHPADRIVDTPGAGTEPGLAFTVAEDGTVTP